MPDFKSQGKILEPGKEPIQIIEVRRCVGERPGKLDQDGREPALGPQWFDPEFEIIDKENYLQYLR